VCCNYDALGVSREPVACTPRAERGLRPEMQSNVQTRRAELQAELAELERVESESPQSGEARTAHASPVSVAPDPAALTQEQQRSLKALQEVEQRGREQLDRKFPAAWNPLNNPDHPKVIPAALILRIDPHVGPSPNYGTYSAVIELRDGQGREWSVWANKPDSKLWNTLLRLKLQPGEVVAVRDNGKRPSKWDPAKSVHDIDLVRVEDDTGPQPVDYDRLERAPRMSATTEAVATATADDDIPF
jgi:hypothetical protein